MIRTLLVICAVFMLLPAGAAAQRSSDVWATVNVCDTVAAPNTMGVRASMPGLKRKATLRMRFRVQYLAADGRWLAIPRNADSKWQTAGRQRGGHLEYGWSFNFPQPKAGRDDVLRGVVYFQWRQSGKVVRRARRITEAGHTSTIGADPPGFSAGTCRIS
jgi:hypothetical protein